MDSIRKPYLRHVLVCIAEHPSHRIEELLSWNVAAELRSDTRATRRLNRQPRQDGLYRTLTDSQAFASAFFQVGVVPRALRHRNFLIRATYSSAGGRGQAIGVDGLHGSAELPLQWLRGLAAVINNE